MKKMIKIIAESALQLDPQRIEELGISIIEIPSFVNGTPFAGSVNMTREEKDQFRDIIREKKNKVTTTGLAVNDLIDIYTKNKDNKILSIHPSFSYSATGVTNRKEAIEKLENIDITLFDTCHLATAYTIQVVKAAQAIQSGMECDKLLLFMDENRKRTGHLGVIHDLFFLNRTGRRSALKAFIANTLNFLPLLGSFGTAGSLQSIGKVKNYKQANLKFLDIISDAMKTFRSNKLSASIAYCGDHEKEVLHLQDLISQKGWETSIIIHYSNHSNMIHQGPDFYDIGYIVH